MRQISRRTAMRGGVAFATTAVLTSWGSGATAGAATTAPLAMSVMTLDVTPEAPPSPSLWMAGYGWVPRGNSVPPAIARPLRAHCAVIYDNGVPNILLRADVVSFPRSVHQQIRTAVVQAGLVQNSSDFMLAASHTHSGAFIGDRPDPYILMNLQPADVSAVDTYTSQYVDDLVNLVKQTAALAPTPVSLSYGVGQAPIAINRTGLPYTLPDVPVLLATRTDNGSPFAVLFGHACHGVCRGNDEVYDSDHCGYASQQIEAALGVPALFFQGAAGDQNPSGTFGPDLVVSAGQTLADAVVSTAQGTGLTPVTGPILTSYTEIELPFTVDTTDPTQLSNLRAIFQWRIDNIDASNPGYHDGDIATVRHANVMVRQIDAGTLPNSIPMPIQCWKLGGLTILAVANELISGYAVALQSLGVSPLWIIAYANEVSCYVSGDELSWAGFSRNTGYESGISVWDLPPSIDVVNQYPNGYPYVAGGLSSMIAYGWPAPLAYSPNGTSPAAPGSTEATVMAACKAALGVS